MGATLLPHFNSPEHWHQRAEEARVLAEGMSSPETRATMLRIARDYDELGLRAAMRVEHDKH